MPISTDSIIHYTRSFPALRSILSEGFKIKYCAEPLNLSPSSANAAHPMISFCDIPLSDSQQHFGTYGYYGIGLSKAWAVRNGVNPVVYLDANSVLAECISLLLAEQRKSDTKLTDEQQKQILYIKSFAKNYAGKLTRKSKVIKNYKFYDEREWRLVPKKDQIGNASFSVGLSRYMADKEKFNKRLSKLRFSFDSKDISYLIVRKTSEIPKLIECIRLIYSEKCTAHELDTLFSKVCSTEQIMSDF